MRHRLDGLARDASPRGRPASHGWHGVLRPRHGPLPGLLLGEPRARVRLLVRRGRHHDVLVQATGAATLLRGVLRYRRADAGTAASGSACTAASGTSDDGADATRLVTEPCAESGAAASTSAAWWLCIAAAGSAGSAAATATSTANADLAVVLCDHYGEGN